MNDNRPPFPSVAAIVAVWFLVCVVAFALMVTR